VNVPGAPRRPAEQPIRLGAELELAVRLALEAGAALRRARAEGLAGREKDGGEVVTAADLESDRIIRHGLTGAFPSDSIYSEETADDGARLSSRRVWIVDPLDSTSTYVAGGDEYCLSIGLAVDGRAALGVVYNPAREELFSGCVGAPVTLNGASARATEVGDIARARLTASSKEWRRGLDRLSDVVAITPMASMAYKLARVAAGLDDGVVSTATRKEWGSCGGTALVLAAGGRATDAEGRELRFNRPEQRPHLGLVAAGPALHPALLELLRRSATPPGPALAD
jgi:myo-inositol-1(or 4)-monophosphatase